MEATIVLPVLILCVLSMVLLTLHFYRVLESQTEMHKKLITETERSEKLFHVRKMTAGRTTEMRGLATVAMSKDMEGKRYVLNEASAIRLGEAIK